MATTTPGTPYVESSDLVANYPAVSEALAERVDLVGVLPFADAAARTTALPTPTDGQYSYLQDTNATEYWDGAAWVAAGVTPGLVHINTTAFSASASFSLNDIFTTDYDFYKVFLESTASTNSEIRIRFRAAGTDNTTSNYDYTATGALSAAANQAQGIINLGRVTLAYAVVDIMNPALAKGTGANGVIQYSEAGAVAAYGLLFTNTDIFDGMTIYTSTGTITGKIKIYGYNNS
jgi:hypothetical protein